MTGILPHRTPLLLGRGPSGFCPKRTRWFLPQPVEQVQQGQHRMAEQHARPCGAHHRPDLLSHVGLVAMDGAPGARRFALLEGALLQALPGIAGQRLTFAAQAIAGSVSFAAVEAYHGLDGSAFTDYSRMSVCHDANQFPNPQFSEP